MYLSIIVQCYVIKLVWYPEIYGSIYSYFIFVNINNYCNSKEFTDLANSFPKITTRISKCWLTYYYITPLIQSQFIVEHKLFDCEFV